MGCSIVGVVLVLVVVAIVGLTFLGGQIEKVLAGTIEFGSGGTGCSVSGSATTFRVGQPIHTAAHLTRQVPAGETVTVQLVTDGSVVESNPQTFSTAASCVSIDLTTSGVPPGAYRLEYLSGAETLSSGSFTLTP